MNKVVRVEITFITDRGERIDSPVLEAQYDADRRPIERLIRDMEFEGRLEIAPEDD
jgi:hypothetical protein